MFYKLFVRIFIIMYYYNENKFYYNIMRYNNIVI